MTAQLTFDGEWRAAVTDDPLPIAPRFTGTSVDVVQYADVKERERWLLGTFGSQDWLWDTPDVFRFDPAGRNLVGAEFQLPGETASAEDAARVPVTPAARPGGLRADEARDFRHEITTVLCRAPGDTVLTCLRDLEVLDEPLEARIGIAPDVALLVQHGTVVGWSLTDPVRYLTTTFADPDPGPPSPEARRLLTECLDLTTEPVLEDVEDGDPVALARLRAADE
ncbi:hypothetical protein [Streptomyces sp. ISL-94]|uniref:hypothetical protein n=1 Tax=Streptomyces sp. ISL-94 TaxID=2819190 RepID=UPI0020362531|nr:hypothetical protein [Streptomyces sp. ISL-94]